MSTKEFVKLVIQSLEAIEKQYRHPYESHLYERVLCYEFYHQFRKCMEQVTCPFILHGELDKRYRNIERVPDFIFHIPGTEKNLGIIQFKSTHNPIAVIKEDLRILREFKGEPLHYEIGILVIFGKAGELKRIRDELSGKPYDVKLFTVFFDIESGKVLS